MYTTMFCVRVVFIIFSILFCLALPLPGSKKKAFLLTSALVALIVHARYSLVLTEQLDYWPALLLGIASAVVSLGFFAALVTKEHTDIIMPIGYLYGVGWIELLRLRPDLAEKQSLWLLIACLVAILTYRLLQPITLLERYRKAISVVGVALLFSALAFGTEVNGAKLWLQVGELSFQPIEIVKVLLVVTLACFWRRFRLWLQIPQDRAISALTARGLLFLALGWFLALTILVVQRDLGMALLLIGVLFSMLYLSTGRRDLVIVGVGGFFLASAAAIAVFDHVRVRIRAWWDPFYFFDTDGYQLVQGLYAIADGGPWGRGLFLGQPQAVPEAHTDYILVAISQELGWLTALCIIACTAFLAHLFFRLAAEQKQEFQQLLLAGLASLWAIQCFIIIAGTTKVIPMTGLTLPFTSYGGSSLLANAVLVALVVRCRRD